MSAVGVTPEWSAKDLLAHLAYWERAAAEEIREFEAGRWPPKKRTRGQMERINREAGSANRATPRHLLREELILARSEIVAAMKRAPEELEERSPLAHIVYSRCVRHRDLTWNNSKLGWPVFANRSERKGTELMSIQLDSARTPAKVLQQGEVHLFENHGRRNHVQGLKTASESCFGERGEIFGVRLRLGAGMQSE